jgi:hypothetical protein
VSSVENGDILASIEALGPVSNASWDGQNGLVL